MLLQPFIYRTCVGTPCRGRHAPSTLKEPQSHPTSSPSSLTIQASLFHLLYLFPWRFDQQECSLWQKCCTGNYRAEQLHWYTASEFKSPMNLYINRGVEGPCVTKIIIWLPVMQHVNSNYCVTLPLFQSSMTDGLWLHLPNVSTLNFTLFTNRCLSLVSRARQLPTWHLTLEMDE